MPGQSTTAAWERQPTDQDPIPFSFLNMSDASWTPPAQQACHAPFLASQRPVGSNRGECEGDTLQHDDL